MTPPTRYDITRPLRSGLAGWPGDTPFDFRLAWSRANGAAVNVGAVTMSVHAGTHADAPFHFDDAGATAVDALDLDAFLGPALVADVIGTAPVIRAADLAAAGVRDGGPPRVLLKTNAWPDEDDRFPNAIPVLGPDACDALRHCGVILLGVDLPSVDALDSKTLPVHRSLAAAGIQILEGLVLADVPPGPYELVALPLRLAGGDGAPVRAVLLPFRAPGG
jgi:arylformamidase